MTAMYQTLMVVVVPLLIAHASGSQISPSSDDGEPVCTGDRRTLWSIVWSCIATIFVCTWIAIHPDVPGHNVTTNAAISSAIDRAKLMVLAVLAPEIIVGWAAQQFATAWRLRRGKYDFIESVINPVPEQKKKSKLTMAHGFFLCMGGFYYTRKSENPHEGLETDEATSTPPSSSPPSSVLRAPSDCTLPLHSRLIPEDTSDYDALGRLVDINLLRSEPNLVKMLAAINPKTIEDKSKGDAFSKTISILQLSWFIVQCVARANQHLPITLLEMSALAFTGLSIITYLLWWYKPLNVQYHISLDEVDLRQIRKGWYLGDFDDDKTVIIDELFGSHQHLRFRTSPSIPSELKRIAVPAWTVGGVGCFFGVFHCLAWSFSFPSHAEMVLWRVSSLGALVAILAMICALVRWEKIDDIFSTLIPKRVWWSIQSFLGNWIASSSIVIYIVARMMLIALAFLQLRHLSPLSFCTVQWTTYIPHIY
ncbi:hypothetical protein IW261DRAFT_1512674 [Armillaria novae-zelandiae]|uniref:Uncharacterized protein n=1 Tax=Armillaria novae-zelandiae TaxID=153914 RepID=A0AA39U043_9AGAR|nr:hypothetical protein IW261DRAFT_1512674 [Armillaria novae-zelandiae]